MYRCFILIFPCVPASTTRKCLQSINRVNRGMGNFYRPRLVIRSRRLSEQKKLLISRTDVFLHSRTHPTGHARVNSRTLAAASRCIWRVHGLVALVRPTRHILLRLLAITRDTFASQRPVIARRLFVFIIFFFFFFPVVIFFRPRLATRLTVVFFFGNSTCMFY